LEIDAYKDILKYLLGYLHVGLHRSTNAGIYLEMPS